MELRPNPKLQPFIDALLALNLKGLSDDACIACVKPLVQEWVLRDDWILPEYLEGGDDERNFIAYVGDDGFLFVDIIVWSQTFESVIHDHNTWAVLGCVKGAEKSTYWKRLDDGTKPGYAKIEKAHTQVAYPGDVCALNSQSIHCVCHCKEHESPTISMHVYGYDLTKSNRQKYDPVAQTHESMAGLSG
jgi:3-mercaptopropionate dioxygenase